ncbi:hypothetical protein A1O1_07980 [Capronia coronata CBS 617.96]|uniref:Uncharacterized protein n=1 Tax=Capronia coronata CBS 617.96 TaxID=1182541 RepID=W9XNZ0_9EURO|nr:uncharacterized protein A1O1_07980 [Capronia coronata CBS 617.96]EXJ81913.1 hypothetical protein A1O1_07980 [Capronia coronata CBS 617.96]
MEIPARHGHTLQRGALQIHLSQTEANAFSVHASVHKDAEDSAGFPCCPTRRLCAGLYRQTWVGRPK